MAFDPQGSLNLSQHIRTNVNNVFASSIPGNENDFIGATPLSGIGFCVDVVLESWTESFVVVIPRNDPASGDGQFGWIPHHHDPRHYHLFFLSRLDFVVGAYFFPPVRNLSLTYITAQSLSRMVTEQPYAGLGSWHPWPRCKAFDPRESLNLGQHIRTNVSCVFADRKSTRLNSSHLARSRMPSSA